METITLTRDELKGIVHDSAEQAVIDLVKNSGRLAELLEAVEDFHFGKMIEEGRTGRYVSEETIMRKLGRK
jgi:hypothetical protein